MGRALVDASPAAAAVFERADRALDEPLSKLMFDGPLETLTATANAQPAILTASIAALAALKEAYPDLATPHFAAGHSLGEYTALVAAEALEFEDALRIVRLRGQAMQNAVAPGVGSMAAIMGGDSQAVQSLCDVAIEAVVAERNNLPGGEQTALPESPVLSPANYNAPGQVVIAGHVQAVDAARRLASDHKLKAIALKVSAPFHCSLMAPAAEAVMKALSQISIKTPLFPVVANVDAKPNSDSERIRELLVQQVDGPVRWQEIMRNLYDCGQTTALEIGPGKVLAGLAKRCKPSLSVTSLFDPETIESAISSFRSH